MTKFESWKEVYGEYKEHYLRSSFSSFNTIDPYDNFIKNKCLGYLDNTVSTKDKKLLLNRICSGQNNDINIITKTDIDILLEMTTILIGFMEDDNNKDATSMCFSDFLDDGDLICDMVKGIAKRAKENTHSL